MALQPCPFSSTLAPKTFAEIPGTQAKIHGMDSYAFFILNGSFGFKPSWAQTLSGPKSLYTFRFGESTLATKIIKRPAQSKTNKYSFCIQVRFCLNKYVFRIQISRVQKNYNSGISRYIGYKTVTTLDERGNQQLAVLLPPPQPKFQ